MARACDRLGFALGQQGRTAEAIARFREAARHVAAALRCALSPRGDAVVDARPRRRPCRRCSAPWSCGPTMRKRSTTSASCSRERGDTQRGRPAPAPINSPSTRRLRRRTRSSASRCRRWAISRAPRPRSARRWPSTPTLEDAANSLGLVQMHLGHGEAAIAAFKALLARNPDYETARHNLGTAFMHKGDLDARRRGLSRADATQPRQRRGLLQPRHGPQAAGRLRGRRGGVAPRRRARSEPAGSALHAGRRALADRARRSGRRRLRARPSRRRPDYAEAHYMLGTILGSRAPPKPRSPSSAGRSSCSRTPPRRT